MNFIYENTRQTIFPQCSDINSSGIHRFTASPMISSLIRWKNLKLPLDGLDDISMDIDSWDNRKTDKNYIISAGVTHSPWDWCGYTDLNKQYAPYMSERKSVFAYLSEEQLSAIRKKQCYLLLDQSHEGYHTTWLFEWFHDCCLHYAISPTQVIYVTGNLAVCEQYIDWCNNNLPNEHICVIPHIQFEDFIQTAVENQIRTLPTSSQQIEYKTKNMEDVKVYNAFQKRPRPHRIWLFSKLYENHLIDSGINSMNSFSLRNSYYEGKSLNSELYKSFIDLLPMYPRDNLDSKNKKGFEGPLGDVFEQDFNQQATLDTWISLVSEASFAEDTCFISEKSFKPIATCHPFITYGNKHSLKYLRGLGYKTFSDFIDESYDELESWDRLDAIIKIIQDIKAMPSDKKLKWFSSMQPILDHNFNTLNENTRKHLPASVTLLHNYFLGNQ